MAEYVTARYKGIVEDLMRHRLSKTHSPVEVSNLLSRRITNSAQREEYLKLMGDVLEKIKMDIDYAHSEK